MKIEEYINFRNSLIEGKFTNLSSGCLNIINILSIISMIFLSISAILFLISILI